MEYGAIGLSEEEAIAKYGAENLEVYHVKFNPLEWRLRQDDAEDVCYAKLICLKTEVLCAVLLAFLDLPVELHLDIIQTSIY